MSTLRLASNPASRWIAALGCAALIATVAWSAHDESTSETSILPSEHPAIDYAKAPVNDPAARLSQKLQSGETKLEWSEGGLGYLPSLLENLGVNSDSQVMVFSKTSFQAARISPRAVSFCRIRALLDLVLAHAGARGGLGGHRRGRVVRRRRAGHR